MVNFNTQFNPYNAAQLGQNTTPQPPRVPPTKPFPKTQVTYPSQNLPPTYFGLPRGFLQQGFSQQGGPRIDPGAISEWNKYQAWVIKQKQLEEAKWRQKEEEYGQQQYDYIDQMSKTQPYIPYAPWMNFEDRLQLAEQRNPFWFQRFRQNPTHTDFVDWIQGLKKEQGQREATEAEKARKQEALDWRRNMEEQMRRELQYRDLRKRYFPDEFRFQEEDQQDEAEQARRDIERRRLLQAYASRGMYDTPEMHRALDEMNTLRGG